MLPYSGFSRYIPRSIFLSLSFFSLKSRSAFPVLVLFDKRPALLLLINVFGIPDQPCADFLFILFPLRLPLPLNLIDCFILILAFISSTLRYTRLSSTYVSPTASLMTGVIPRFASQIILLRFVCCLCICAVCLFFFFYYTS